MESTRSLALFGGEPFFAANLHVGRPNVGSREQLLGRIDDILERRWFSNQGPLVQDLEAKLCAYLGVKHCILICNATVALEIATRALDLSGEVIVPAFTFIATAHSLQWQGITPVFCDLDPQTHNLDPAQVEKLITPRTTGIMGVHIWGRACAVEALEEIAQRHRLKLLFDAAHGFACSHGGRMIGNFGQAEVFSFHATKFYNTAEGGAIATNDDALAAKIRLMKNFGFAGLDRVIYIGTNGKMNELSAAVGLTNLESLDEFLAVNRQHYATYRSRLEKLPGLKLIDYAPDQKMNYQYIVLEVDGDAAGLSRDELLAVLRAENVLARRYFYPGCHRMEPYLTMYPEAGRTLPQTERLCQQVLILPTGTAMKTADVHAVCDLIAAALEQRTAVREYLAAQPGEASAPKGA